MNAQHTRPNLLSGSPEHEMTQTPALGLMVCPIVQIPQPANAAFVAEVYRLAYDMARNQLAEQAGPARILSFDPSWN